MQSDKNFDSSLKIIKFLLGNKYQIFTDNARSIFRVA